MGKKKMPSALCALPKGAQLPTIFFFNGLNKVAVLLRGVKMFSDDKGFPL
jgi:hypothetical protein